jgi:hypothetical protein
MEGTLYSGSTNSGWITIGGVTGITFGPRHLEIESVIVRGSMTIVKWSDGTKTKVFCGEDEYYDSEKAVAMCVVKKYFGNYTKFAQAMENVFYDETISRKEKKQFQKEEM